MARIIGNANPAFSLGFRSNATYRAFEASWLWRAANRWQSPAGPVQRKSAEAPRYS